MSQDFWFLLLPGFSVMGFVSAVEPLRVANRFHADLYRWHVLSADGGPVLASNGMSVNSDGALEPLKKGDLLFVVAGFEPLRAVTPALVQWLRKLDRNGVTLGGIDTGSVVLAEAGLLDGRRATLHWEAIDAFQESYPQLSVTQEAVRDRRSAHHLGRRHRLHRPDARPDRPGPRSATGGAGFRAVRARPHPPAPGPPAPAGGDPLWREQPQAGAGDRRDGAAYRAATDHPGLAERIQVTRRQLERLFRVHLDDTPSNFYLGLRLDKARQLLRQTDLSVLQVSLACGFESPSYFSRSYRARFAASPSQDRAVLPLKAPAATPPGAPAGHRTPRAERG